MSTVNLAECLIRFRDRQPADAELLQARLLATRIQFIPPDTAQAVLVAQARLALPLNFGDCFAYALAKTQGVALLTLDSDFRSVDVSLVMPPKV